MIRGGVLGVTDIQLPNVPAGAARILTESLHPRGGASKRHATLPTSAPRRGVVGAAGLPVVPLGKKSGNCVALPFPLVKKGLGNHLFLQLQMDKALIRGLFVLRTIQWKFSLITQRLHLRPCPLLPARRR